ncbi:hypothetical protein GWK47_017093 [Chionoecetes opilio]|uniref:HTH CENPB-type domain-containing protein n=1 Tax=Chionoecetes opilio TaxID=41210 RepID=A0A8J4XR47_CHIOP|nr:hypothetical protein GWK47_017093 [Chionoecetes opilio]
MPRKYTKKVKLYTETSIQVAIEEVNAGASVRSTAKKYHISTSMVRKRCLLNKGLLEMKSRGRKTILSMHLEQKLASYIKRMAELGFGPTKQELQAIVFEYLEANELGHLFNDKPPGDDWIINFMGRHRLSLKKAGLMQKARKNVKGERKGKNKGMRYVVNLVPEEDETSFEAVIKSRGHPSASSSQPQKRHRISMHGAVLTDAKFLEQQKSKEDKKKKKTQKAEKSDSDVDSPPQVEVYSDSSGELSDLYDENIMTLDKTVKAALGCKELLQELPKESEIKEDMFYAVWYDRPSTY